MPDGTEVQSVESPRPARNRVGDRVKYNAYICKISEVNEDRTVTVDIIPSENDGICGSFHNVSPLSLETL